MGMPAEAVLEEKEGLARPVVLEHKVEEGLLGRVQRVAGEAQQLADAAQREAVRVAQERPQPIVGGAVGGVAVGAYKAIKLKLAVMSGIGLVASGGFVGGAIGFVFSLLADTVALTERERGYRAEMRAAAADRAAAAERGIRFEAAMRAAEEKAAEDQATISHKDDRILSLQQKYLRLGMRFDDLKRAYGAFKAVHDESANGVRERALASRFSCLFDALLQEIEHGDVIGDKESMFHFLRHLDENNLMRIFSDPISYEFLHRPVVLPTGATVNAETSEALYSKNIPCPVTQIGLGSRPAAGCSENRFLLDFYSLLKNKGLYDHFVQCIEEGVPKPGSEKMVRLFGSGRAAAVVLEDKKDDDADFESVPLDLGSLSPVRRSVRS